MLGRYQAAMFKTDKTRTVCFSGHRELPTGDEQNALRERLNDAIGEAIEDGYNTFLFGGAIGFDLLCAELILKRKRIIKLEHPQRIRLVAVLPFEEQAAKWSESDREIYYDTLPQCDEVITLSTHYHDKAYYDRNKWMVDRSGRLICYFTGSPRSGTGQTVRLAREQGLEIINLHQE